MANEPTVSVTAGWDPARRARFAAAVVPERYLLAHVTPGLPTESDAAIGGSPTPPI